MEHQLSDLPDNVRRSLTDFVNAVKEACSSNLESIVLFGSAAEGRLRPTSDVNLILVLKEFEVSQINQLREKLRVSHAAILLNVMFILESEISAASDAFAVKFTDILHRHRVLFGTDPFKDLKVSRTATVQRLRQVIVNLMLRLRERYALVSLREEQLVPIIADFTGPIRASAATILELESKGEFHPKEALQTFVQQLPGSNWTEILKNMSIAREEQELKTGEATATILGLLDLLKAMHDRVQGLK
ncbi:MAG TPA: nucleotidyltransferase domain-containing protein [Bacteriovoracaceae bacterium]|nr:nucleotidyltransferase domain-containing protein [Bacteriovoracaceae bacterium]